MIASIENIYNRLKTKIIYPKTKYQAVFDDNGNRLDTDIAGIKDKLTEITKMRLGERIDISSYTSNPYTTPSEGYVYIALDAGQTGRILLDTSAYASIGGAQGYFSAYVHKGAKILVVGTAKLIAFVPLS